MNILIINHYAGSKTLGMEYRPFYIARELNKMGHNAVIICASHSHLRRINFCCKQTVTQVFEDGVTFCVIKTPKFYDNGSGRAKNTAVFISALFKNAAKLAELYRPDAVIASSTYLFDIFPAMHIARLAGARVYYELHDIWPMSPVYLGKLKRGGAAWQALAVAEKISFNCTNGVISLLEGGALRAREVGADIGKVFYVPNGILPVSKGENSLCCAGLLLDRLKSDGLFTVVYAGGFAKANDVITLVKASKLMPKNIAVVIIGRGEEKKRLMHFAKLSGCKVYFEDYIPKESLTEVLSKAGCLYIGAKNMPVYRYGAAMNKIYDYMLAGRPILNALPYQKNDIIRANCGVSALSENPYSIASAAKKLSEMDKSALDEMGARGLKFVTENRSYKKLAELYLAAVEEKDVSKNH